MDVYYPARTTAPRPAILYVHGRRLDYWETKEGPGIVVTGELIRASSSYSPSTTGSCPQMEVPHRRSLT